MPRLNRTSIDKHKKRKDTSLPSKCYSRHRYKKLYCRPSQDKKKGVKCRERALKRLIEKISNPHINTKLLRQITKKRNIGIESKPKGKRR